MIKFALKNSKYQIKQICTRTHTQKHTHALTVCTHTEININPQLPIV